MASDTPTERIEFELHKDEVKFLRKHFRSLGLTFDQGMRGISTGLATSLMMERQPSRSRK